MTRETATVFLAFICLFVQECYLENDQTSMFHVAKALMSVQALYGIIPNIYGKGDCAKVCSVFSVSGQLCQGRLSM